MVLAAFYSSTSVAVLVIALVSWVLFWGTLSAAILAIWRAPNLHSLWMGLAGPIGPFIAVGIGLARPKPLESQANLDSEPAALEPPRTSGPRVVP